MDLSDKFVIIGSPVITRPLTNNPKLTTWNYIFGRLIMCIFNFDELLV